MNSYTSTNAATKYNSDNFVAAYISEVSLKNATKYRILYSGRKNQA